MAIHSKLKAYDTSKGLCLILGYKTFNSASSLIGNEHDIRQLESTFRNDLKFATIATCIDETRSVTEKFLDDCKFLFHLNQTGVK